MKYTIETGMQLNGYVEKAEMVVAKGRVVLRFENPGPGDEGGWYNVMTADTARELADALNAVADSADEGELLSWDDVYEAFADEEPTEAY